MTDNKVKFNDEIPISIHNPRIYDRTFVIEQWFRRIVYTALVAKFGNQWISVFHDKDVLAYQKMRRKSERGIISESSEINNIIWMTTIYNLTKLINEDFIRQEIEDITATKAEEIAEKLLKVKDIRNIVAHNRAVSEDTKAIFQQLSSDIEDVIIRFKNYLLYNKKGKIIYTSDIRNDFLSIYFNKRMYNNDYSRFQAYIEERKYFYSIIHLPSSSLFKGSFINIELCIEKYKNVMNNILGLFINKIGDEYQVLIPKHRSLTNDDYQKVVDIFMEIAEEIWIDYRYELQDANNVCNPQIWFYENRLP